MTVKGTIFQSARQSKHDRYSQTRFKEAAEPKTTKTSVLFTIQDVSATYDTSRREDLRQFESAWYNKDSLMKFMFSGANSDPRAPAGPEPVDDAEAAEDSKKTKYIYDPEGSVLHSIYDSTDSDDDDYEARKDNMLGSAGSDMGTLASHTRSTKASTVSSRSKGSHHEDEAAMLGAEPAAVDFVFCLARVDRIAATANLDRPLGNTTVALTNSMTRGISRVSALQKGTFHTRAESLSIGSSEDKAKASMDLLCGKLVATDLAFGISKTDPPHIFEKDTRLLSTYCIVKMLCANIDDHTSPTTLLDMNALSVYLSDTYVPSKGDPKQEMDGEVDYRMTSSTEISWDSLRAMITPDSLPNIQKIADRVTTVINEENRNYEQQMMGGSNDSSSVLDIGRGVGTVQLVGKSVRFGMYEGNFQDSEWWVLSVWGLDLMSESAPRSRFQSVTASIGKNVRGEDAKRASTGAITVAKYVGAAAKVDKALLQKEMIEAYMQFALGATAVHNVISLPPIDHSSSVILLDRPSHPGSRRAVFSLFTFDFMKKSIRVHANGKYYIDLRNLGAKYQDRATWKASKYQNEMQRRQFTDEAGSDAEAAVVFEFDKIARKANKAVYNFEPTIRPIEATFENEHLNLKWFLGHLGLQDEEQLLKLTHESLHVPLMSVISSVELQLHRPDGELDGAEHDD